MTVAVDTNVLLDLLTPGAPHNQESQISLESASNAGPLVICEVVYSELAGGFADKAELDAVLDEMGVRMEPSSQRALFLAGEAWRSHVRQRRGGFVCQACGKRQVVNCTACGETLRARQHLLADFAIGAHALVHADQLLTRDRGYYRTYFSGLKLFA